MKNLLAIVADYYPNPSSNTNCFEPLLSGLEQDDWHIDIITVKQWIELSNHEIEENGREIWRINDPKSMNTILQNQLSQIPTTRFLRLINKILTTISKSFFFIKYCLFRDERRFAGWSKPDTIKKCLELHSKNEYDLVLSVSYPVISHEIAIGFLDKVTVTKPQWILYEFDPYCYNEHMYGKKCYKKLADKQHRLFKSADHICLTPELYDFYQATPFNIYKEKMISIKFPNMKPINFFSETSISLLLRKERINCVFGGAFGIKIRDPQYALQTFTKCNKQISWTIMTGFNLTNYIDNVEDVNSVIKTYPVQSRDTSYKTMQESDVLVNIGNTVVFQTPGKIFEYMAMGKPIIHFQKIENDPCLKYLKDYPMTLIINEQEDDPEKHARLIENFCEQYKGKWLSFEEVATYIPQYVSENVVGNFVNIVDDLFREERNAKK